jgi:hypothetical protein
VVGIGKDIVIVGYKDGNVPVIREYKKPLITETIEGIEKAVQWMKSKK